MKLIRTSLLSLLACIAFSGAAHAAQGRNFGLGIVLGEPTGITGRFSSNSANSIHGSVAFSFSNYFLVTGDYVFNFRNVSGLPPSARHVLSFYAGVGGALITSTSSGHNHYFSTTHDSVGMGVRIPLGVEWNPVTAPFGVFLEIAPGMGLVPGTYGFFQGGLGAVFYLN